MSRTPVKVRPILVTPVEWAYLAGFFDGEGCIASYKIRSGYSLHLSISQQVREPLDWIVANFGGYVRPLKPYGFFGFRWQASERERINFILRGMYPFLINKQPQAKVALAMIKHSDFSDTARPYAAKLKKLKRAHYE